MAQIPIQDVARQLAALESMTTTQLAERFEALHGEPTRSRNKAYLKKKVAWRIQELAEGGLSERAQARIEEINALQDTHPTEPRPAKPERDPRLPAVGEVIVRRYKGTDHEVRVLADGFEFDGERYRSLSRIAREITGTTWNGYLFFGLTERKKPRRDGGEA